LFGYLSAAVVTALLFFFLHNTYFPSQKELALKWELEQMKYLYGNLNEQLDDMAADLQQIHERDAGIHRTMLEMDPIDDDVWQGGVGGSEKYSNITRYPNSAEVLVSTHAK